MVRAEPSAAPVAEEHFLCSIARDWRRPHLLERPDQLDWRQVVTTGLKNRMATLLAHSLSATGSLDQLPEDAALELKQGVEKNERRANRLAPELRRYLSYAAEIDQEVVVLKGLWLSEIIYGSVTMRPGADIDILLRERDVPASLVILEDKMGYGRWWRPLLDDPYYYRHHLHQQRCNHDRSIWFEPHWLFDHPYTALTIDYDALIDRTTPGQLWGEPIRELSPADLLLSLCVHLVKHAVYLPCVLDRPDLRQVILADGLLMYFVDVAESLGFYEEQMDWPAAVAIACESGARDTVGSVLRFCFDHLGAQVPSWVLDDLNVSCPDRPTHWLMNRTAGYQLAVYQGQSQGSLWSFLLGFNESIIFRPIRLLDLIHYLVPGRDYLLRRYGRSSIANAFRHLIRASGQYLRLGADTLIFTWRRWRRVRRLDRQGYHWPGPPKDV